MPFILLLLLLTQKNNINTDQRFELIDKPELKTAPNNTVTPSFGVGYVQKEPIKFRKFTHCEFGKDKHEFKAATNTKPSSGIISETNRAIPCIVNHCILRKLRILVRNVSSRL